MVTKEIRPIQGVLFDTTHRDAIAELLRGPAGHTLPVWKVERVELAERGLITITGLYYANGDIFQYSGSSTRADKLAMALKCALALQEFHVLGAIHGNVKPENFLVTDNGEVHISDVQLNLFLRQLERDLIDNTAIPGSSVYKPHEEVILQTATGPIPSSTAGDVAAFAGVVYKLMIGRAPMPSGPCGLARRCFELRQNGNDLGLIHQHSSLDGDLWQLLMDCWSDPVTRPSMQQVVARLRVIAESGSTA
ncbi:hypothetical protein JAAARDRAFT_193591 [Jaapia argillacea MUCL 33604]|uniref:Protein kinase domain-containing protein n=1 Tax=Jaapia argillacea MUCL 33604 TaxID=933084 RepID=A0A067Q3S7_9AGAM|nr:hypothetical protein JAAARDRAFT_193591 [Jaapia argillacea MUCL 33604]